MKVATIHDIKQELSQLPAKQLVEICVRLGRFKNENKELLAYLLFDAHDEEGYIDLLKKEMDELFTTINQSNLYFAKKTVRKILRFANKHIRYIGSKTAGVELLTHFCKTLKDSGIPFNKSPVLNNLYQNQLKKVRKTINTLHEDLQYDYLKRLAEL